MKSPTLAGPAEVAEILGVSRQRVHVLATSDREFPTPIATLAAGTIWNRRDILKWAAARKRTSIREAKSRVALTPTSIRKLAHQRSRNNHGVPK